MRALGQRWQRDVPALGQFGRGDQLRLTAVPRLQDLGGGSTAQNARVDEPCEFDMRKMARGAVYAFKVPDGFGSVVVRLVLLVTRGILEFRGGLRKGGRSRRGIYLIQETTAILFRKNTCEAPWLVLEGLDIHDLNQQDIAGLCAFYLKGTTEVVNLGEVDILHIVG